MIREIKFRAWAEDVKSMTYFNTPVITESKGDVWGVFFSSTTDTVYLTGYQALMQFTGLKDKNDKDIYEGDIVRRVEDTPITYQDGSKKYPTWHVDFKFGGWHFESTPKSPTISYPAFYSNAKYMEVIGNIYENPEFMEVSNERD